MRPELGKDVADSSNCNRWERTALWTLGLLHGPIVRNRKALAGCQVAGYVLAQRLGFDSSNGARWRQGDDDRCRHELVMLPWGLVPGWADDLTIGNRMINARSDSVAEKPAFRNAFKKRRCLVIADGFYGQRTGKAKRPCFIYLKGRKPFCFAGLCERWSKGEKPIKTCTVLTTDANKLMAPIHDRMPVIVAPRGYDLWLDAAVQEPERLQPLLRP